MEAFLFVVFLIGIIIALVQDVKRREVDNWLTSFLFVFGVSFLVFASVLNGYWSLLGYGAVSVAITFVLMNVFYYGRVFGGGDAKLLFALSAFFVGATYLATLLNIFIFILLLFFSGALYGLSYILVVYAIHFKDANKEFKKRFDGKRYAPLFVIGLLFLFLGLFLDVFFILGMLLFVFPFMYVFAKVLEDVAMIKTLSGIKLREGDWLVSDEKIGRRVIKSNWEGLTKEEVNLLSRKKSVRVKDGIPFLPAFLIAYLLYYFLIDKIGLLLGF
jgi:Flp pilus assembly protein protease CpaA